MTDARTPRARAISRRELLLGAAALSPALASACEEPGDFETLRSPRALVGGVPKPRLLDRFGLVTDRRGILDLPPGYSYTILQRTGTRMSDGFRVPGRPDGMACVTGDDGSLVVLRNHENRDSEADIGPYFAGQAPPEAAYDPAALGSVTRLVLDPRTLELRSSNLVVAGTSWNCACGSSPLGFLTCEEVTRPGHGFVFACDWGAQRAEPPLRIDAYGRFRHEAAAFDPDTLITYLTEDQPDACFYRFVPSRPETPLEGVLQAMRVVGRHAWNTGTQRVGERLDIDWIDVEDPTPVYDSVRGQAQARGAARVQRTEGIWLAGHELYLCASFGGRVGLGQVLRVDLEQQTVEVLVESLGPGHFTGPDSICMSPHGVLYVAEDGIGDQFLRRITLDGEVQPFARNAASQTEMAGLCFSPDGKVLFVNVQEEGLTLAIRGPFEDELKTLGHGALDAGLASMAQAAHRLRSRG